MTKIERQIFEMEERKRKADELAKIPVKKIRPIIFKSIHCANERVFLISRGLCNLWGFGFGT